uniref:Uncharacterized protein n=1 Tax=Noctiluca scintillans TaxID=2966 RepID=A0A6T8VQR0_NOCSC|mmetsp:Transcript_24869/g.65353  ORF Transcript_24869/g.65353 Transcript_24869/m.65353 type:complete len:113 (+) Transcript_24869:721-1059(+)
MHEPAAQGGSSRCQELRAVLDVKKVQLVRSFQQRHGDRWWTHDIRHVAPVQRDMVCTSGDVTSMVPTIDFDLEAMMQLVKVRPALFGSLSCVAALPGTVACRCQAERLNTAL